MCETERRSLCRILVSGTMETGIIYKITCPDGLSYIGKTTRSVSTRVSEHKKDYSSCRVIQDAFRRNGNRMTVEVLLVCSVQDLDANESHYIETMDTVFPRGYNMRCGKINLSKSGNELSSFVTPREEHDVKSVNDTVRQEIVDIVENCGISQWSGDVKSTYLNHTDCCSDVSQPIECSVLRDVDFSDSHGGVRFNIDADVIDLMDILEFVCSTTDAARQMKTRCFSSLAYKKIIWKGSTNKRRRFATPISDTVALLESLKNTECKQIAKKIKNATAVTVAPKDAEDVTEVTSDDEFVKRAREREENDSVQEFEYKKRKRERDEEDDKRKRELDEEDDKRKRELDKRELECKLIVTRIKALRECGFDKEAESLKASLMGA